MFQSSLTEMTGDRPSLEGDAKDGGDTFSRALVSFAGVPKGRPRLGNNEVGSDAGDRFLGRNAERNLLQRSTLHSAHSRRASVEQSGADRIPKLGKPKESIHEEK